jgi:hypothetical protein
MIIINKHGELGGYEGCKRADGLNFNTFLKLYFDRILLARRIDEIINEHRIQLYYKFFNYTEHRCPPSQLLENYYALCYFPAKFLRVE